MLAMAAFALSALFLDFYGGQGLPQATGVSYFDVLRVPGGTSGALVDAGAVLTAFGVPVLIAVFALLALTRRDPVTLRHMVIGAVVAWAIVVVGTTLSIGGRDLPVGPGFWVQAAAAGVAIAGLLLLFGDAKADTRAVERSTDAASQPPR